MRSRCSVYLASSRFSDSFRSFRTTSTLIRRFPGASGVQKYTRAGTLYVYPIRFENTYTRHRAIPVLEGNGQRDSCGPRGIEEEDGTRPRRQLERGCQTSRRRNHTEKTEARSRRIHRQASRVLEDPRLERISRDPKMAGP